MNSELPQSEQERLRKLIDAVLDERADDGQRQQLDDWLSESDAAVEFYATYIDLHAELRWRNRGDETVRPPKKVGERSTKRRRVAVIAVCVASMAIVLAALLWPNADAKHGAIDKTVWKIEPIGDAQFVFNQNHVQLTRGEIHVASNATKKDQPIPEIVIETPTGTATARGTEFFIGAHSEKSKGQTMRQLTRVLILTGMVTLANSAGSIEGGPMELLAAEPKLAPVNLAVQSNSEFAVDLYRELCQQHADENVFFSPYSLHIALTMALEGARGKTAKEMGTVLHFPKAARQIGDDQQSIPWRVALLHSGHGAIAKRFTREETKEEKAIREKIKKLNQDLATKNLSVKFLSTLKRRKAAKEAEREARKLANEINSESKKLNSLQLNIANSLWGDRRYPFHPEFVAAIDEHYNTKGIFPADFQESYTKESKRIDNWVRDNTGGKIKLIMPPYDPQIAATLRLVLVNAIYFQGDWMTPFKPDNTRSRNFYLASGTRVKAPSMADYGNESVSYGAINADGSWFKTSKTRILGVPTRDQKDLYPDEDGFQILAMPYKGDAVSMIFLLPRKEASLSSLRKVATAARISDWIKQLERRETHLRIPKFSMSTNYNAIPLLKSLGMQRAFVPALEEQGANFAGMTQSDDPKQRMHISAVIHRATVEVNENGTVATAASAIMTKDAASAAAEKKRVPFTPRFYAERPFMVLIRDMKHGTILFMGHVNDPRK